MDPLFGGPPGELFQVIAGTSMSSPHAAGVSALVKAVPPDWTPGQVKSALMTSAVTYVLKEDGVTPADPFDTGAGSIRADLAVDPTLTFDETAANYFASAADPLGRIDLNVPSVDAPAPVVPDLDPDEPRVGDVRVRPRHRVGLAGGVDRRSREPGRLERRDARVGSRDRQRLHDRREPAGSGRLGHRHVRRVRQEGGHVRGASASPPRSGEAERVIDALAARP